MNKYIKEYRELRNKGYNDLEAFGTVASAIALVGSIHDLRAVRSVYMEDMLNDCEQVFNEGMGSNNERVAG